MNKLEEMRLAQAEYERICKIYDEFVKEHTTNSKSSNNDDYGGMTRSSLENSEINRYQLKTIEDIVQLKELDNKRMEYYKKFVDLYSKAKQKGLI
jgi:hypothetical protein